MKKEGVKHRKKNPAISGIFYVLTNQFFILNTFRN